MSISLNGIKIPVYHV